MSNRPDRAINARERMCDNGSEVELLDIVEIPFIKPVPRGHHVEDHLIDPHAEWRWLGVMPSSVRLRQEASLSTAPLWLNIESYDGSSYNGLHDRIPEESLGIIKTSLRLIHVDKVVIEVTPEELPDGAPRTAARASFDLGWHSYKLKVTDPKVYQWGEGRYELGDVLMCISLGEPYKGYAYKLVASIIR